MLTERVDISKSGRGVAELEADEREILGHPGHETRNGQHLHRVRLNLRRFPALKVLVESQLRAIEHVARVYEVKRRSLIFREGDPSDRIFLLRSGVVKLDRRRRLPEPGVLTRRGV